MFGLLKKILPASSSVAIGADTPDDDRCAALKKEGNASLAEGRFYEAARLYREATEADPGDVSAFVGLARAQLEQKKLMEARAALDVALVLDPNRPDAHLVLGTMALRQGDLPRAVYRFGEVLRIDPGLEAAYEGLVDALLASGERDDAEKAIRGGMIRFPQSAGLLFRLGNLDSSRNLPLRAIESYEQALATDPQNAQFMAALGIARDDAGEHEHAVTLMRRALTLKPGEVNILFELGLRLWSRACFEDAAKSFNAAVKLDPEHLRSHISLALVSLVAGDYATGWPEYEWRFRMPLDAAFRPHKVFPQPLWLGAQSIEGKTILLHCEQGYGDTLQFCRYAADVAALGARVVLQVQRGLGELMAGLAGVALVVEQDHPLPSFDVHCPLMSLPLALGHHRSGYIPSQQHYLKADAAKRLEWQRRLADMGQPSVPKIGVVWSGYVHHERDGQRSIALAEFLKLLPAGVHAVCLQPEVRESDLPVMKADSRVTFLGPELKSFSDTAALIDALDLVVTVDTSVAHAAGALGKPVWLLVSHIPDWRWLLNRTDSPWYPGVTIFRQNVPGDWAHPLAQVRRALKNRYQPVVPPPDATSARDLVRCGELKKKGNALLGDGKLDAAGAMYSEATCADPMDASAFVNLGYVLSEQKRLLEAAAMLEHALMLDAGQLDAHFMLGTMAQQETNPEQAIYHFREALRIESGFELAWLGLGYELFRHDELKEAEEIMREGIRRFPDSVGLLCNLGNLYSSRNLPLSAIEPYEKALALEPENAQIMSNLGAACEAAGDFARAIPLMRRALDLNPGDANTLVHLGISLSEQGFHDDAIKSYRTALELDPGNFAAHFNLGFSALLNGDYATGWNEYEWRLRSGKEKDVKERKVFARPLWLGGEAIAGQTILLSCEQGFGDTIQFSRYATEVAALGAHVVLQVQAGLKELMGTLPGGIRVLEEHEPLPPFDCYCPLMSLPLALGHHRTGFVPASLSYLKADPDKKAAWQQRLAALAGSATPQVGIVWSGNANQKRDRLRSLRLAEFLQALPAGMPAICLQPMLREVDVPVMKTQPHILCPGEALKTFADTAAVIDSLDLVVTSDTSVAHLAGAMGKPVWILVPYIPDWRWLLERSDSPWYPSARIFRQAEAGDWRQPLEQVREALSMRYRPLIA